MDDNFFDDDFSSYDDDVEEESIDEHVVNEKEDLVDETSSIAHPLSDPLTAAFLFGYAEEISEEEKRRQDGEPSGRINKTIEKVSPISTSNKVGKNSNYPEFFDYVLKRRN